ncbi:MAG: hypothetical protein LBC31_02730 [Treponema sp.]|jgi:hypothetical protein|nr:hypothetical protein [Treponema sp.]
MKKILITLGILLIAGGAVFFSGWVQLDVPPGSWGVLRSKTHGPGDTVIREGQFHWVWYKLIPRNVTVSVFQIREQSVPVEASGILPSGDVYSAMAGLKTDFSYRFSLTVLYRLKGESLPGLADRENLLTQEDLDSYTEKLSGKIENRARGLLWAYGENEKALTEAQRTGTIRTLEAELRGAFPDTENLSCTVKILRIPDFILYNEVRSLYRDYLAAQRGNLRGEITVMAVEAAQNRRRLEELSAYGELLTKYPILLRYLALEKGLVMQDQ